MSWPRYQTFPPILWKQGPLPRVRILASVFGCRPSEPAVSWVVNQALGSGGTGSGRRTGGAGQALDMGAPFLAWPRPASGRNGYNLKFKTKIPWIDNPLWGSGPGIETSLRTDGFSSQQNSTINSETLLVLGVFRELTDHPAHVPVLADSPQPARRAGRRSSGAAGYSAVAGARCAGLVFACPGRPEIPARRAAAGFLAVSRAGSAQRGRGA